MNEKKENVIVNGFFWRFAERCGVQLISAVVSILLARILTPDDYGKVALVTVFNNIMYVLLDCGIGTALVQKKEVDELDYSSAFFFSIVISFVLYGGMFVAAPYLAAFYNDPSMTPIFRGISLTVAVCGIKTIQQAHVTRNMKFQYFFYSAFAGAIVSTVLGLGLAYMGFGVWALVVQQVSNITVDTLVLWKLSSWRPKMEFSWQHLKGLLSYGWKLLASSLSSVIYNNLRSLIIGKMYTSADLAYYNQGDNLTYNIASSVDTSIESVLFPVMSSLQDDRAQVKNMTRRSIKTCTYIIAPVMMSIAFCAEPLVRLILTEKWLPCVLFLRVFCLGYACWPIITANMNAAKAVGRSDLYLKCQLLNEGVCILLLLATFRVSVEAIAYGMLITNVVTQILDAQLNKKLIGYGYLEQMCDILPTLLLAAGAGLCMYLVIFLHLPDLLTVIIQVVVGLGIYLTGSAILFEVSEKGVDFISEMEMTAEEAFQSLAPKIGRPNDKEVKAKAFLMEMLKDGEMLSSDCEEKLEAAGFKKSTIKKAKKNTGVISRKKGFLWYWSLPMGDIPRE